MKQSIGNACGTIAALHAICNHMDTLHIGAPAVPRFPMPLARRLHRPLTCTSSTLHMHAPTASGVAPRVTPPHRRTPDSARIAAADDSFLRLFHSATVAMDPEGRGTYLEDPPEGAPDIEAAHQVGACLHGYTYTLLVGC
jgi:hypothetical protein